MWPVGIVGGSFTSTEAAATGAVYALLVGTLYYRSIKLAQLVMRTPS